MFREDGGIFPLFGTDIESCSSGADLVVRVCENPIGAGWPWGGMNGPPHRPRAAISCRSRAAGQASGILEELALRPNVMATCGGEILEEPVSHGTGKNWANLSELSVER